MSPPPSLGPGGSGSSGEEAPNYLQRLGITASRFALSTGCAPVLTIELVRRYTRN